MLVDGALFIVVQTGVHGLRHGQGVDIGRLQLDAAALGCCPQKAHIKGVDVVSHQNAVARKGKKSFQRFLFAGGVRYHLVGDAGQLGDLGGDGLTGLDEGIELLHHLAVADDDRANLSKILYAGVKTGGLGIEHAEFTVQRLILYAVNAGHHVVHKIGFAPVDELEIRVFFVDVIGCQHGFRIALTHAVVGDGNGGVSHAVRQLDDAAGVAEAVHAGKLGVQMQLHPLFRGSILPLFALHDQHIVGAHDVVVLVFIVGAVATHNDRAALANALPLGAVLPFLCADLQVDRSGIVGDGHSIDLAVVALDLGKEHIAPDHALAALAAQILEGGKVFGGEHFAVEDGDRLVGKVESLHLDGRCGVLFLEFDHRRCDLALQLFLHLLLLRRSHCALQRYLGGNAGMLGNTLCKQFLKAHLLQKLCAVAHPHRDVLPGDGNAAPVQKAVDGHTVPLHVLQQDAQSVLIQHGIAEQVFDLQFKAFIVRLQGSQQPGAEVLIQRGGTAQGKLDLPVLPQHPGVLHDHLPETGRKIRVRHKLRPQLGNKWFHKWYSFLVGSLQHKLPHPFLQVWQ